MLSMINAYLGDTPAAPNLFPNKTQVYTLLPKIDGFRLLLGADVGNVSMDY